MCAFAPQHKLEKFVEQENCPPDNFIFENFGAPDENAKFCAAKGNSNNTALIDRSIVLVKNSLKYSLGAPKFRFVCSFLLCFLLVST